MVTKNSMYFKRVIFLVILVLNFRYISSRIRNRRSHGMSHFYYKNNPFLKHADMYPNNPFFHHPKHDDYPYDNNPLLDNDNPYLPSNPSLPTKINVPDNDEKSCRISFQITELIVNGEEFEEGSYPWLAALFSITTNKPNYICAGTLVSDKYIITAAHCVNRNNKTVEPTDLLVVLGRSNLENLIKNNSNAIKTIYSHPDYKRLSGDGDIAILELQVTIQFTETIKPACLWSGRNNLEDIVGLKGVVAGWGNTENGNISLNRPKAVKLPVVSQETCLRSHAQFISITSDRTFCAGIRDGSGPCNGDSGSGLVIQRNGLWELRGIVSLSIGSGVPIIRCDLSYFVVFTDVSKFIIWIQSIIDN